MQLRKIFDASRFVVVAPSVVAGDIWKSATSLPYRTLKVVGHCKVDHSEHRLRERRSRADSDKVRVAFVGYPVMHKGWHVYHQLVEETRGKKQYEFYHFGKKPDDGRYSRRIRSFEMQVSAEDRDAMSRLLREQEIDIVVLPALWPETFSFVTFEALAAGCDIITLETSGNIAAVVKSTRRGRVFATEDELVAFFTSGQVVDFVRWRSQNPNPLGTLIYNGTSAALVGAS